MSAVNAERPARGATSWEPILSLASSEPARGHRSPRTPTASVGRAAARRELPFAAPSPTRSMVPAALVAGRALSRPCGMGLRPTLPPTRRQPPSARYGDGPATRPERPIHGDLASLRSRLSVALSACTSPRHPDHRRHRFLVLRRSAGHRPYAVAAAAGGMS